MKHLNILFPIFDHLYIFQLLEYAPVDFLKWFIRYPFKRNLQVKNKLKFTQKSLAILFIGLFLIILEVLYFNYQIFPTVNIFFFIFSFLYLIFFSPVYLIFAQIIFLPFEIYTKRKIIQKATSKINRLKELKVVAIVGSFGKTSVKNMLYTLLWKDFRVVKTPKSFNTKVSISKTIIEDLKDTTQVFLCEMDAYHPGDIQELAAIAPPSMAIITAIAAQHLERFGSMEKLAKAQFEIADTLGKKGVLFLNSQDLWTMKLAYDYKAGKIFFGQRTDDSLSVSQIRQTNNGLNFILKAYQKKINITVPLFGKIHAFNFLAAATIAYELGLPLKKIQERAGLILPTPHRLEIKKIGGQVVIDNSYNTNPTVSRQSLKILKDYPGKQKFLITPGLVELGRQHHIENQLFAKEAARVADQIFIVGENARDDLLKGLEKTRFPKEKTHLVKSTEDGLKLFQQLAGESDVILLENDLPDQYF